MPQRPRRAVIMGAAGRDFHDFNVFFRGNDEYEVVAFTAEQIPDIEGREYPEDLAGDLYDEPIPIEPADDLEEIIQERDVDDVFLSYSDLSHEYVMHQASRSLASGASFSILGPDDVQIETDIPVLSVCAVRTGCGKSQTTREITRLLRDLGYDVGVVRHPMPYGDLSKQRLQKFADYSDLEEYETTLEEREEYEHHIEDGNVVYAGVDYEAILERAEEDSDLIVWDGGNNDIPFFETDLHVVLTDPLRLGDETRYHPGETNLRMADYVLVNKIDTASGDAVRSLRQNIYETNPDARLFEAASPISVEDYVDLRGKRVLVVEDGPTVTHGGMGYGAGYVGARKYGAEPVDPSEYAVGTVADVLEEYDLRDVVPAMGYSERQLEDLEETIRRATSDIDGVVLGAPIDLGSLIDIDSRVHTTRYDLETVGNPNLEDVVEEFVEEYVSVT